MIGKEPFFTNNPITLYLITVWDNPLLCLTQLWEKISIKLNAIRERLYVADFFVHFLLPLCIFSSRLEYKANICRYVAALEKSETKRQEIFFL